MSQPAQQNTSRGLRLFLCGAVFSGWPLTALSAQPAVSFQNEIAPILARHCQACHGSKKAKSGYRLHTYELLKQAGKSDRPSVTPGMPGASQLFELMITADDDERMPMNSDPLDPGQIALVRQWIEQGAQFDGPDPNATLNSILPSVEHPQAPQTYPGPISITSLAFSPDGSELAVGGYHEITIWDTGHGRLQRRIGNVARHTSSLAYSPDGRMIVAGGGTPGEFGEVRAFDSKSGQLLRVFCRTEDVVLDIEFSPDGQTLAICGAFRGVRLYDSENGQEKLRLEEHMDWVTALDFSKDGALLATASRDKTARVFDLVSGKTRSIYREHKAPVDDVAFAPDEKRVLSAGGDNEIHIWRLEDAKKIGLLGGMGQRALKFVVAGDLLYSCSPDGKARQHKLADNGISRVYAGDSDWIYSLAYQEGNRQLALGGYSGMVRIWRVDQDKPSIVFDAVLGRSLKSF